MEHRCGNRRNIKFNIRLLRDNTVFATGYTRNISTGGCFLVTDYKPLNGNECIEFEVVNSNDSNRILSRGKALVMHAMPDGLGLMFEDPGLEIILSNNTGTNRQSDFNLLKAS